MNVELFMQSQIVANVGWVLLHSIWQFALVAIALRVALLVLRERAANVRYIVSVAALAIALVLPVITLVQVSANSSRGASTARIAVEVPEDLGAGAVKSSESVASGRERNLSRVVGGNSASTFASVIGWVEQTLPDLLPFSVLAWLIGAAFTSLRLGGGFSQLRKYRNESTSDPDEHWQRVFNRLIDTLGIKQTIGFVRSEIVETPIAIGVLRPMIVVPASLFLQITPHELETIIAHEMIHIRRYDPLVNVVQCVIESVFFYHPAIWWMSAQIRREREFAADAAVVEIFEGSHVTYARALANLEEIRLRTNQQMPRYATAANGGNFMQRIQRILNIKTEAGSANSAWTAGVALLLTSAFLLAVFSFSSSDVVNAQQRSKSRKLAIGFVGIPPVDRTANPPKDSDATARLLIQKLKENKVPAIGFLTGSMVSDGEKLFPVRANIAKMWIESGFELGLGGFTHMSLYDSSTDDYIANIEKNEGVAKKILGDGVQPRYFSYPFLNTGKTVEDKAKIETWLASRGYASVKYTFDNQEWMYSYAYDMARNDNDLNTMKEIREAYLGYMSKMFDHYEAYSAEMFGRDIPQTMVLTPSRLITDTADEFFAMVAKRGYTFVSVDEAQKDPAYKTTENFIGKAGISWFERWAMAKGTRLRDEPEADDVVQKIWNDRKAMAAKK